MTAKSPLFRWSLAAALCLAGLIVGSHVSAQRTLQQQSVLGPGLYVFQTRLDTSTCGQDSETGNVTSYYAAIDGVPGAATMSMNLMNSSYWPTWSLAITNGRIEGDASQARVPAERRGQAHFEVRKEGGRFIGRGYREYFAMVDGSSRRCRMEFDALLRRIDVD